MGDHVANDVLPVIKAGMAAALLVRRLWGVVHVDRPEARRAHARVEALPELLARLAAGAA